MNRNKHVRNLTCGSWMKFGHAVKAVELCACAWVEYGVSVRRLTPAEAVEARKEQARQRRLSSSLEVQ